ncbi:MAG: isoprenylcysteine carboxylmethyltransferase family protein [Candidatus Thorarchaeota archaeon]|nr:isoprenylcysteine carboxylmethyltransferase family protein [Candidatus Thorarchaeota archaeon]
MIDLQIIGPVTGILTTVDVITHIYLDIKKIRRQKNAGLKEPNEDLPRNVLWIVTITTLLSFLLVLVISVAWLQHNMTLLLLVLIVSYDSPMWLWIVGFALLESGIFLHLWSRAVRGAGASSWLMPKDHRLVTRGPYSQVRHPSYLSYWLSFAGLFLMFPSLVTAILLTGIPAYYQIAIVEERGLLHHFGDTYREYMNRTGRFLPRIRSRNDQNGASN